MTAFADPNFMTSLARGLDVICAFSREPRQLSIAQLSRKTGIPRAAVRRCLHTLRELGYVASPDGRAYQLQPKLLGLGYAYLSSTPMVIAAQPFLDRVSEAVDEACSLGTLDGDDILYLARSLTSRILSVTLNVGSRLPAHRTSIGLVLLAHLPPAELEAHFAPAKLREQLQPVRNRGYAIADQLVELGVRSIAVPVRNAAGTVVAGMNVIVQAGRVPLRELRPRYLPRLRAAAAELSAQLAA